MRTRATSLACCLAAAAVPAQSPYEKDFAFAVDALQKECGQLIESKKIDWARVKKELAPAAKQVKTERDHLLLLTRLLARLEDGHARVETREKTKGVRLPDGDAQLTSPGITLCRIGEKIYVRSATKAALDDGAQPGCEVATIDGTPAKRWLEAKCAALRDTIPFSTNHHAFAFACGTGLSAKPGTKLELGLVDAKGGARKVALRCASTSELLRGPAVLPEGLEAGKDLALGELASGFGYVHVRRCKEDLPEQIDAALAKVGGCKGLVLDFRGNSGGGFDHPALMGRFVPKGEALVGGVRYESAGPSPYGGPVVVIVDAHVVSAGETASGIFKEDGRAYMIGESPTAGMSSQKRRIELPSGLFGLYVSTGSNKGRFNEGKGIEGIGVVPHEVVPLDPKLASQGTDTWIKRAEELLADFPRERVRYRAR